MFAGTSGIEEVKGTVNVQHSGCLTLGWPHRYFIDLTVVGRVPGLFVFSYAWHWGVPMIFDFGLATV